MSSHHKQRPLANAFLVTIYSVLFCFLGLVILTSHASGMTVTKTLQVITDNIYLSSINIFFPGEITVIPLPVFFYIIVSFSLIIVHLLEKSKRMPYPGRPFRQKLVAVTMAVLFVQTGIQTLGLAVYWQNTARIFSEKTTEEKYIFLFEKIYQYALAAKEALPGIHKAELITNLDLTGDPGTTHHRTLAYFLFPIDIKGVYDGPQDTLVIFHKKNARAHVPDGYKIVTIMNKSNLIAIRNDIFPDLP